MDKKRLQELSGIESLEEAAIYSMNPEDPMNPEVLVQGVGRYTLKTLKQNVRGKLADLAKRVAETDDPQAWREVAKLLDHAAMRERVKTIVSAHDELQAKRKKGGTSSRGIEKE